MSRLRSKASYANVTASIALFVALGGTGYAAIKLPLHSVSAKYLQDGEQRNRRSRARQSHMMSYEPRHPTPPGLAAFVQ